VTFQIIKQSKTAHFKLVKSQNSINPENIKKSAMQKHPRDINLSFGSCITGAYWKTFALDHSSRPEQSELMNTAQLIKQRTKSMQNHKKKIQADTSGKCSHLSAAAGAIETCPKMGNGNTGCCPPAFHQ